MELTTRIFKDLAVLADWAFQSVECEPGTYTLTEVSENKDGKYNICRGELQTSSLPECATWANESEYIVKLSYNGGMQEYTFAISNVFDLLARFKKIAVEDITAKEKRELCIITKKKKPSGELLAVVEMPKTKTKQVAKAAAKDDILRPVLCGVYVDNSGYIVACNRYVVNVCKITGVFADAFNGAILPAEFAKRADGCTVEIYKDGDTVTAYCGEENEECINEPYLNWRAVMDSWGKICEKGHIKVKFANIKKAVGKDKAVTLSMCDGGITVSTFNKDNDPGLIDRHIQVEAEHDIKEFVAPVDTEYLKKVMPCCNNMYITDNRRPLYFIGDGCLSLMMPICNENIPHCDITQGETLVSVVDVMEPQAQFEEEATELKPMSETTCEERPTLDDYHYYTWLMMHEEKGSYMTIADKALAEALTWIFIAAHRRGKGHIIAKNKYGVLIEIVIATDTSKEQERHPERLQHSGLWRRNTFRRLRVRRYSSVSRVVGGINGENATERKETGKFPRWYGCKYRQFTRGSTRARGMNGMTGGINENISKRINEQYHGEMYCRGG